jgi:SAM-dependent methyltransferase
LNITLSRLWPSLFRKKRNRQSLEPFVSCKCAIAVFIAILDGGAVNLIPETGLTMRMETALAQFEYERAAARALLSASAEDRPALYQHFYSELYEQFPHLQLDADSEKYSSRHAALLSKFVGGNSVVLETGCGRGHTARFVGPLVGRLCLVDVANLVMGDLPENTEFRLYEGNRLPYEANTFDLVYNFDVVEHLHPEDAEASMREFWRVLKPGGKLVVGTPSRVTGPHDISNQFLNRAEGLHLKEYDTAELHALFRRAGFTQCRALMGGKGKYVSVPCSISSAYDYVIDRLPHKVRRLRIFKSTASDRMIGVKSSNS